MEWLLNYKEVVKERSIWEAASCVRIEREVYMWFWSIPTIVATLNVLLQNDDHASGLIRACVDTA